MVKIWYEVEPEYDAPNGPEAAEEIIEVVANSPQQAKEYALMQWDGHVDRIEIVDVNPDYTDEYFPFEACSDISSSMKRLITASQSDGVIFEDEFFELVKTRGVGMKDTPWTGLEVKSKGLAKKHVIEIRLNHKGMGNWDGTPYDEDYDDVYISQGMRMQSNSLHETQEVIDVLEDAIDFSYKVLDWLRDNGYSVK